MRGVRRSAPDPAALGARAPRLMTTELERAQKHYTPYDPDKAAFAFTAYKDEGVKRRLEELFHGKCAYCESGYAGTAPVDVEHYRPKGSVEGAAAHPGYWWLGMVWSNLLPSCIDCNRRRYQVTPDATASLATLDLAARHGSGMLVVNSGKQDAFPIRGPARAQTPTCDLDAEDPLLLDPTRDDPDAHLDYHTERPYLIALALPAANPNEPNGLSERGAVSIQVYGLNRLGLVQERTRLLRRLDFLGGLVIELSTLAQEAADFGGAFNLRVAARLRLLAGEILSEIRSLTEADAPYSAMVRHWRSRFLARVRTP